MTHDAQLEKYDLQHMPTDPFELAPEIVVTPTGFLAYRASGDERSQMEELAWARHELLGVTALGVDALRGHRLATTDLLIATPPVRALARDVLGREVEELVDVTASYPFDWSRNPRGILESIFPQLPGYVDGSYAFFADVREATDEPMPPFLSTSFETTGLDLHGILPGSEWERWRTAFEARTRQLVLRRG